MDDFTKTKIGFTIALLAVAFTLHPVINTYGHIGFNFLNLPITIKLAFFLTVSLLGVAVYFISLQFISFKQFSILNKISDIAYALSLTVPIVFISFWLLILTGDLLSNVTSKIPNYAWNIVAAVIAGGITGFVAQYFKRSLMKKNIESKREESTRKEMEILMRVDRLIREGHYDLSIIDSFKVIELALRQAVEPITGEINVRTIQRLLHNAVELNIITANDLRQIDEIRTLRNEAAHLEAAITKEQALKASGIAKRLLKTKSIVSSISGYNWLSVNRDVAIRTFKGEKSHFEDEATDHLLDAWKHRDGAVSGEISVFFETGLIYKPELIFNMFRDEASEFDAWLKQIDAQMFTDYLGEQVNTLERLKKEIISSLTNYVDNSTDNLNTELANKVIKKVSKIRVRKIV